MQVTLPKGWVECDSKTTKQVFAMCFYQTETIEYYPRWYLPWFLMKPFIQNHERAHAHGIKDCLSNSNYCIMKEDNDTYVDKLRLLCYQILHGLTFCKTCQHYLNAKNTMEDY